MIECFGFDCSEVEVLMEVFSIAEARKCVVENEFIA
jgi:hypothetical protein